MTAARQAPDAIDDLQDEDRDIQQNDSADG